MDNKRQMPEPAPARAPRRTKAAFPARLPEPADAPRLIQELQLYKIELEMQDDELHRVRADLNAARLQVDHLVVERTAELTRAIAKLSEEVQLRYQAEVALRKALLEAQGARDLLQAENRQLRAKRG